jgi:hypothetical protein
MARCWHAPGGWAPARRNSSWQSPGFPRTSKFGEERHRRRIRESQGVLVLDLSKILTCIKLPSGSDKDLKGLTRAVQPGTDGRTGYLEHKGNLNGRQSFHRRKQQYLVFLRRQSVDETNDSSMTSNVVSCPYAVHTKPTVNPSSELEVSVTLRESLMLGGFV